MKQIKALSCWRRMAACNHACSKIAWLLNAAYSQRHQHGLLDMRRHARRRIKKKKSGMSAGRVACTCASAAARDLWAAEISRAGSYLPRTAKFLLKRSQPSS